MTAPAPPDAQPSGAEAAPAASRGYVFAVTGPAYLTLARRAARSLRRVVPDAAIDLFADAPPGDPVFDREHPLERRSRRPKMEALLRSRFERTLYLDADVIPLAPFDDVFDVLDRFDIALTAEQRRNDQRPRHQIPGEEVPAAFPQLNGGFMAVRRNPATDAFLEEWRRRVHDGKQRFDQAMLRVLLYRGTLRMHILPAEYNVMFLGPFMRLGRGSASYAAPRLLHWPALHEQPPGDPEQPFDPAELLHPTQLEQIRSLLSTDRTIRSHLDLGPVDPTRKPAGLSRWARWRQRMRERWQGAI